MHLIWYRNITVETSGQIGLIHDCPVLFLKTESPNTASQLFYAEKYRYFLVYNESNIRHVATVSTIHLNIRYSQHISVCVFELYMFPLDRNAGHGEIVSRFFWTITFRSDKVLNYRWLSQRKCPYDGKFSIFIFCFHPHVLYESYSMILTI